MVQVSAEEVGCGLWSVVFKLDQDGCDERSAFGGGGALSVGPHRCVDRGHVFDLVAVASDLIGIDKTDIACPQGNSGGPLYIGAWAIGLLSASYNGQCMFSKVENAEIHFGVFVQTS